MIYTPSDDSFLLKKELINLCKAKKVLDMGAGSGILSQASINSGASSVLAADISKEIVINLKNQGIKAVKSDLFSNVNGKFDIIVFNPPYLPEDKREGKDSALATTGGKKGDEIIIRFLKQAKKHLNKNGIILTLVSSLTPRNRIIKLLDKLSLKQELLASKKLFFETLSVLKITK